MTPEDIRQYVGLPYELGADGPDRFDCRGLVCHILRQHFGRAVPDLPVGTDMAALWSASLETGAWETVATPSHGDAVVMRGGADPHVGIYLAPGAPGVLHAYAPMHQVIWTPLDRLRVMGFGRLAYVRCHALLG